MTLSTGIFVVNGVLYFNLCSDNEHVLKIKETRVKIPGVQLPELLESAKITGVYTAEADAKIPGVDMVQEQDVDFDLNFAPANEGSTK